MTIKQTLLTECLSYKRQPERLNVMIQVDELLATNARRYTHHRGMLSSRHPILILLKALRRLWKPSMDLDTYLFAVYDQANTLSNEAGIFNENGNGITDVGNYFNQNSIANLVMTKTHPLEVLDGATYFQVRDNENCSLLGITPSESLNNMQYISSILIDIITLARDFHRDYLGGLIIDLAEDGSGDTTLFQYVTNRLIGPDCIKSYHDSSMFNRYLAVANGEPLSIERVATPFSSPDLVPMLNKAQTTQWTKILSGDWRSAFSKLELRKGYTMYDLLEDEVSYTLPVNQLWMDILNELQWAEMYLLLSGERRGINSVIARYLKDIKADALLTRCKDPEIKAYIVSRMEHIALLLSYT